MNVMRQFASSFDSTMADRATASMKTPTKKLSVLPFDALFFGRAHRGSTLRIRLLQRFASSLGLSLHFSVCFSLTSEALSLCFSSFPSHCLQAFHCFLHFAFLALLHHSFHCAFHFFSFSSHH